MVNNSVIAPERTDCRASRRHCETRDRKPDLVRKKTILLFVEYRRCVVVVVVVATDEEEDNEH